MEIKDISVARLMTSDLVTVTPDTPLVDAGDTLLEQDIGSLVVVDEAGQLAGILTGTDFIDIVSNEKTTADSTVEEYMTESVVTVDVDDSIRDAAAKMISSSIQHLPVEGDEGISGMLSTTDLTAHLAYLEA